MFCLTHWDSHKTASILQTTISNSFSCMACHLSAPVMANLMTHICVPPWWWVQLQHIVNDMQEHLIETAVAQKSGFNMPQSKSTSITVMSRSNQTSVTGFTRILCISLIAGKLLVSILTLAGKGKRWHYNWSQYIRQVFARDRVSENH